MAITAFALGSNLSPILATVASLSSEARARDNTKRSWVSLPDALFSSLVTLWLVFGSLPILGCNVPLPVAGEVYGLAALHCKRGNAAHLIAIGDAVVILPP
jgi:hypothetical protein